MAFYFPICSVRQLNLFRIIPKTGDFRLDKWRGIYHYLILYELQSQAIPKNRKILIPTYLYQTFKNKIGVVIVLSTSSLNTQVGNVAISIAFSMTAEMAIKKTKKCMVDNSSKSL